MNFLKFALFFLLTNCFQKSLDAQNWVSYQSEGQINDLVDTGDELLMTTDEGLVVMNKITLEKTIYNKINSNLETDHMPSIAKAPNGDIWIGTYDVVLRQFDGTDFDEMAIPENSEYDPLTTKLYDFEIAPNGDFWLGTSDGVFHKQGQTWYHYDETALGDSFFEPWNIEINNLGEVFVASNYIHKFTNGVWSNISENTNLLGYLDADLFFNSTGDLFFAGDLEQIGRYDGTAWEEFDIDLNGFEVRGFTEDTNGEIYFQTLYDGIFKLENNTWIQQMNEQTTAFENNISFFHIDDQDNWWLNNNIFLTVNKDGIIQSTLISDYTLTYNSIYNIHKGENEKMYFIQANDNISVVDTEGNWTFFPLPAPPSILGFNDLLYLADNDIWLASYDGLHHYDGVNWTVIDLDGCNSFDVDAQGKIYVLAITKIYTIDNGTISEYNVDNSPLSAEYLSGHGIDNNGNLWIAENEINAIHKVTTDGNWTTYTDVDHPAINKPEGDFHFDVNGNVWISGALLGAMKFDGTTWSNPFDGNLDLIDNYNSFSIESDATGKVYFAHQYGVTTLLDGEWEDLLIDEVPNTNSSHSSTIQFDDEGTLWWASNRYGVFSYTPASTSSTLFTNEINTNFSIYPNPVDRYTTLDFTIQNSSVVKIFIYDYLGRLMTGMDLGLLPAGSFQEEINLEQIPKGLYNIQLKTNNISSSKTMIIK